MIKKVFDHAPADLKPQERLMLLALAEWARDDTGQCWPGRDSIAQRLRCSARTVDRVLRSVIRRGLVEIVKSSARDAHRSTSSTCVN
ncbi:MAG: helix-turn-helix domain-containing protein [Pseudonocardiaceae bacterium]